MSGIPDIAVTSTGHPAFLVDAKARTMIGSSRPEESYKMLGYLENFRATYDDAAFQSALVFLGSRQEASALVNAEGGALTLLAAPPSEDRASFDRGLEASRATWLALPSAA